MKRKIILVLVMCCLVFSMVACGKNITAENKEDETTSNTTSNISSDIKNEEAVDKDSKDNDVDLMFTFWDPSKAIVFDYPNLKCIEEGTSRIFKNSKYVIVYCREEGSEELKNIPTVLSEKFKNATDCYTNGDFSSFNITETEEININNTEVLMIKGTLVVSYDSGNQNEYPMKGYTFIKDGMMCELIASLDYDSLSEYQAEMEETIDAMIKTLRSER